MRIIVDEKTGNKTFMADEGKAICLSTENGPSTYTTVSAPNYAADNSFKDCEYGVPSEASEADKDAALRRFGVEV